MKRDFHVDIIRCVACVFVIAVHAVTQINFYAEPVVGVSMYIGMFLRMLFVICVPLFIMLTGYLMSRKTFSKKYYSNIIKVLVMYLLASFACYLFARFYLQTMSTKAAILGLFTFTTAPYGWYVEMYIGLFLLIPCLNAMFHAMQNKKQKQMLVCTFIAITALPSVFNIFSFDLFPNWWEYVYPLTYYLLGVYIKEVKITMPQKKVFFVILICFIFNGAINAIMPQGGVFLAPRSFSGSNGLGVLALSVSIFVFCLQAKVDNVPKCIQFVVQQIANHALTIYLVSSISDMYLYPFYNDAFSTMKERVIYMPLVIIGSLLMSYVIAVVVDALAKPIIFRLHKIYKGVAKYE